MEIIMTTEIPTLFEELSRKTFEEIERLVNNREKGLITNAEYKASINTVFNIASGLLGEDFFELISVAGEEYQVDYSFCRNRIFSNASKIVFIARTKGKSRYTYSVIAANLTKANHVEGELDGIADTEAATEIKIGTIIQTLKKQGYLELM
jgi:hypothetical protein